MTKTITLSLSTDYSTLGEAATRDDMDRYGDNLAALISKEFGVQVHQVWGNCGRTRCTDDELVEARIREIESGDEWTTLL